MIMLHPTYTLRVEIQERMIGDAKQFGKDGTGCDEVVDAVTNALSAAGILNFYVHLDKFEHRP